MEAFWAWAWATVNFVCRTAFSDFKVESCLVRSDLLVSRVTIRVLRVVISESLEASFLRMALVSEAAVLAARSSARREAIKAADSVDHSLLA